MERMPLWELAVKRLEMSVPRFLLLYVLPAAGAGFAAGLILIVATGGLGPNSILGGVIGGSMLLILPLVTGAAALAFPVIEVRRVGDRIEKEMHMFITRMGILSLGEIGANSMFDILKQMSDYGELAKEIKSIQILVDKWHTSLPEAARIIAHQSPSPIWADFLDRMAFSVEAGQPIDVFMRSELDTIAEQYNVLYDTRLESVDTLKEIYVSLVSAGLFGLVVAGIHLVLFQTGSIDDPPAVVASRLRYVIFASFLFTIFQIGSYIAFRSTVPDDMTFARDDLDTPYRILFRRSVIATTLVAGLLFVVTSSFVLVNLSAVISTWDRWGLIILAIPFTPFMIPALIERREEGMVLRRDAAYPEFIRALGGTAQARVAEPSATVRALRGIDFGTLDDPIERLERRLATRINSDRAWDFFSSETNSSVISRFNRIYIEGSQTSGQPAATADLVSRTTGNILSLRVRRTVSASTMWGTALGLLIAAVTSLNVTIAVVLELGDAIGGIASGVGEGTLDTDDILNSAGGVALPTFEQPEVMGQNINLYKIVVSLIIIIQVATVSAIAGRLRGGQTMSVIGQTIQLIWIAGITSLVTGTIIARATSLFNL